MSLSTRGAGTCCPSSHTSRIAVRVAKADCCYFPCLRQCGDWHNPIALGSVVTGTTPSRIRMEAVLVPIGLLMKATHCNLNSANKTHVW